MLEAINLTKRFGATVALDSLNLAVHPGDIYCLLGANGAGKTTTINLFLGFIEPSSGEARVNGVDVQRGPDATNGALAYIPETVALYPHLTGMENLEYFAGLAGHEASREQLGSALGEAGLKTEAYSRKVANYSKGMGFHAPIAKTLTDAKAYAADPKCTAERDAAIVAFFRQWEQSMLARFMFY